MYNEEIEVRFRNRKCFLSNGPGNVRWEHLKARSYEVKIELLSRNRRLTSQLVKREGKNSTKNSNTAKVEYSTHLYHAGANFWNSFVKTFSFYKEYKGDGFKNFQDFDTHLKVFLRW